ncbi:hypothetical protein [Endozoicomonas sp. ALC066]|uniref:hypothetical protein n=1 Tax=Endozoicomonas sp. ALC066 TaxID=3403078 RepID=UPI003BB75106
MLDYKDAAVLHAQKYDPAMVDIAANAPITYWSRVRADKNRRHEVAAVKRAAKKAAHPTLAAVWPE